MNDRPRKIYLPIIYLLSWLVMTVVIFTWGPYAYQVTNPVTFYSYLFFVHAALLGGYCWGQTFSGRGTRLKIDYFKFVQVTISISILYFTIKLLLTAGGDLNNFILTFKDANKSYDSSSLRQITLFSYLDMFFVPLIIIAITNTLFSFKKIKIIWRAIIYILIVLLIASSIGSATRSGIVQIALLSFAALMLGIYNKNTILTFRHKILIVFSISSFIVGFFIYFSFLIKTRDVLGYVVSKNPITKELPKDGYFIYKITPPEVHQLINRVSFYTSHSYFRLNQAMNMPSKGLGLGLSNSFFVMDNIEEFTASTKLKEISYALRLDKDFGCPFGEFWSTFYTWIASDFTFPGTIVVIFFIGLAFSLSIKDSLTTLNPFAVTASCTLFYFIFYFAFNNPLQDGQGIMTFLCIPLLWLFFRERRKV